MIRPVSEHQMQQRRAVGCPKEPMAKPLGLSLALDTALNKPTLLKPTLPQPKSPIKKHLQHAWISADPAPVVTRARASTEEDPSPLSASHGPLRATRRASVLHAVLRLLDQDVHALEAAREVLQAAAALPLGKPGVRQACIRALQELQTPAEPPMPPAFKSSSPRAPQQALQPSVKKDSGRAKGVAADGSLYRCREFLLACANEIHELEEEHSGAFDYAEDTASTSDVQTECGLSASRKLPPSSLTSLRFDYASTARGSCSSLDDDDVLADQGSQFSDVLLRAEYLSEDGDEATAVAEDEDEDEIVSRPLRRQEPASPAASLAVKFRAFHALKREATFKRKQLAFARLKTRLLSPRRVSAKLTTPSVVQAVQPVQTGLAATLLRWLLRHPDVLLLMLVLAVLAHVPAHYFL